MLVAIAGILELGAALEKFEDQLVWFAAHGIRLARLSARSSA